MSVGTDRPRVEIIRDIHALTEEIAAKKDDPDFLIEGIEKRQDLMNEFDRSSHPKLAADDLREASALIRNVISLDEKIKAALEGHKTQSRTDLSITNTKQKMMGYIGQAMSSSGSYMDYKK